MGVVTHPLPCGTNQGVIVVIYQVEALLWGLNCRQFSKSVEQQQQGGHPTLIREIMQRLRSL